MPRGKRDALTSNQKKFCEEYVKTYRKMDSYRIAYPNASDATVSRNTNKLFQNPRVLEYIQQLQDEALRQACITPARIANELGKMAFAEVDNEAGLTYAVKQNAIKLLQSQYGLDKKVIDAKVDTIIKVDIEDDTAEGEE